MEKKKLLRVENLSVTLSSQGKKIYAVRGMSFSLEAGKTFGMVGESGSGKTVAVQSLLQLIPSPPLVSIEGKVWAEGEDLLTKNKKELEKYRGRYVGMIFQDPMSSLNPTLTIGFQIAEAINLQKNLSQKEVKEKAYTLLSLVGIPDPCLRYRQYPHELSGGMRQRVMIAIALALEPKILIADEPTTALDVTLQAQIIELLRKIQEKRKMATLLITHDFGIAASLADELFVIYSGKIVENGSTLQILQKPLHPYTQLLLKSLPHFALRKEQKLFSIEGSPPPLSLPLLGCAFFPRCPFAKTICSQKEPPIFCQKERHVACFCYENPLTKPHLSLEK